MELGLHLLKKEGTKKSPRDHHHHNNNNPATSKLTRHDSCGQEGLSPRLIVKMKSIEHVQKATEELQSRTKFGKVEFGDLYKEFYSLVGPRGTMDKATFSKLLGEALHEDNPIVLDKYYARFDTDANGNIDFREFVSGISILTKGKAQEKLHFIYQCYDLDGNGYITRDELLHWIKSVCITGVNLMDDIFKTLHIVLPQEAYKSKEFEKEALNSIVDACFRALNKNNNNNQGITEQEFISWVEKQPAIMKLLCPWDTAALLDAGSIHDKH